MLKDKNLTECNLERYIEAGKKLAEYRQNRLKLRKSVKPNKSHYH